MVGTELSHRMATKITRPNCFGFFVVGYLKSKVFLTPSANLGELEERIENTMDGLRQDRQMVRRAVFSMLRQAEVCLERNGGHVED